MRDVFIEVLTAMSYNKMRIALTGFSIGWGIFLLIVMLGSGNGVLHGVENGFPVGTDNLVIVKPGEVSKPNHYLDKGQPVKLTDTDCEMLQHTFPETIRRTVVSIDTLVLLSYGKEKILIPVNGYYPGYNGVCQNFLANGRNINDIDIEQQRKVCVMTHALAERLFKGEQPIGKIVNFYNVPFLVVGITEPNSETDHTKALYAPFTTVRSLYFRNDELNTINFVVDGLDTSAKNHEFVASIRKVLAKEKRFTVSDERAVSIINDFEFYLQITGIMGSLRYFIWIVGLATLITGVVGVSNIMMITVKERIKELGVRKAMGASSVSIVRLVLLESVVITIIFGYIGILLGVTLTHLADNMAIALLGEGNQVFDNPTVDLGIVMIATVVLVICGLVAGYIPARKAISAKLVDALAGVA